MNKKGFTLVEILATIIILGLIVVLIVPNITGTSKNAKESILKTKINNLEKAAVIYAQDHRHLLTENCTVNGTSYNGVCKLITVNTIAHDEIDASGNIIHEKYINTDDDAGHVINPTNDKYLNSCSIQIYKKYGKIYAVYTNKTPGSDCWVLS